jgi:hypothetical protein
MLNIFDDRFQSVLGYAYLPLMKDRVILKDGEIVLPIEFALGMAEGIDASDTEKVFFKIKTSVVSSVFPQNDKVASFLKSLGRGFDELQDVRIGIHWSEITTFLLTITQFAIFIARFIASSERCA